MVGAARADLDYAGVSERLEVVLADAGYWHQVQMQKLMSDGAQVLIPPDANKRKGQRPGWQGGLYDFMRRVPGDRARRRALRPPPDHDRAGLRPHQVQPPLRPIPTTRQIGLPVAVAADQRHPHLLKLHKHTTAPVIARGPGRQRRPAALPLRYRSHQRHTTSRLPPELRNSHHGKRQSARFLS
jgi:hypothetical protein